MKQGVEATSALPRDAPAEVVARTAVAAPPRPGAGYF